MKLFLIRHGETEWNLKNKINGLTDISLTLKGIEQSKKVGKFLKNNFNCNFYLYSSPLKRAKLTANVINQFIHSDIVIDKNIIERNYASSEGIDINSLDLNNLNSDIESRIEVLSRISIFIDYLKANHNDYNDNIVIISHGSILRHILFSLCGIKEYIDFKNCSISIIDVNDLDVFINKDNINIVKHLD
ncbi:histidine phosphatase family protein [Clostridium estertheticum]|uniref:histidine phosphatase family protein n=1 Tax=Clostridium estertheticum TaxID=238834 RepID=UPI00124CCDA2|nr:histidine phosphatase family protein [Clostridium estertheticum]MBZ9618249.1 histidine phosphatase family protein [Clostridium estertheticum subsp. laramiense]WAG76249.1 histidine phosphatase family protein [Clostridium estertheticum]